MKNFISEINNDYSKNKKKIIADLRNDNIKFKNLSSEIRSDKDIAKIAISLNAFNYTFMERELMDNIELVYYALSKDPYIYTYLPHHHKEDKKLFLYAISLDSQNFSCTSKKLQDDKELALLAVKNNGYLINYVSDRLKEDKDIVIAALKNEPASSRYISDTLISDMEIIKLALKKDVGNIVKRIPEEIINNKEYLLELISINDLVIRYASSQLQDDYEIIEAGVKKNGYAIFYASERLQQDFNLISLAIETYPILILNFADKFKKNKELIIKGCCHKLDMVIYLKDNNEYFSMNDRTFVLELLTSLKDYALLFQNPAIVYECLNDELKNDVEILKLICDQSPRFREGHLPTEIVNTKENALYLLSDSYSIYNYLSDEIKKDEDILNLLETKYRFAYSLYLENKCDTSQYIRERKK